MVAERRLARLIIAAIVLIAAGPAQASNGDGKPAPGAIAGSDVLQRGALVYTDYLYDAWGPNLDGGGDAAPFAAAAGAQTSGDYRYPGDPRYANNGADLRELKLTLGSKGLSGEIALETMADPSVAVATVAIDSDGNPATGAGAWPDGAGLTTPGADLFVTAWGGGARLTTADGRTRMIKGGAKPSKGLLTFTVPGEDLGKLASKARVWAGAGLAGGDGSSYASQTPGATAVFDLAFQGDETFAIGSTWGDQRQSAALASGDLAPFAGKLDAKAMKAGETKTPRLSPGFHNALFRSDSDYGDGISTRATTLGTPDPQFLDRWQPYGLYVPPGLKRSRSAPLLLALHSLQWNQNQYAATTPNLHTELGEQRHSVIITPLARGTDTWYLDSGFADVLEAWDDVTAGAAGVAIDDDRTSLFGYSMGGHGAYRFGLLMPDRFARAVTYVGPPAFVAWSPPNPAFSPDPDWAAAANTNGLVPNALNLPYEINAGGSDTLVNPESTKAQAASFAAAGDEYRFYFHPDATHFTFAADDTWAHSRKWLGSAKRVRNPRRVVYNRVPAFDLPDHHLTFDGAYWVGGIQLRDAAAGGGSGTADVTSLAIRGTDGVVDEGTTQLPAGAAGSTAATLTGQHPAGGRGAKAKNGFAAELENVSALVLDTKRMGLDASRRIDATLTGDGATTLQLKLPKGKRPTATLDGHSVPVKSRSSGRVVTLKLQLDGGGEHRLSIERQG